MSKVIFNGPFGTSLKSFAVLMGIGAKTSILHALGRRMCPDWDVNMETGIRFWRHQFTKAMNCRDMDHGREIYGSLLTFTDDEYQVTIRETQDPPGKWLEPERRINSATLLYFHGGGYTFNGPVSQRFAEMLAHHTGARVFMPHYRLTPEHPHPAQADDAFNAWQFVTETVPASDIAVIGDSAGGHMALMLLQTLKALGKEQPAMCIGLCPWTDIGDRGASLHENDPFDLVQGWMALQFGRWLDPDEEFGREALSPINHDYSGLAPIYIQTGERDILRDMAIDFARIQKDKGADVMLDLHAGMPHDFQAYDSMFEASTRALARIREAVSRIANGGSPLPAPGPDTIVGVEEIAGNKR